MLFFVFAKGEVSHVGLRRTLGMFRQSTANTYLANELYICEKALLLTLIGVISLFNCIVEYLNAFDFALFGNIFIDLSFTNQNQESTNMKHEPLTMAC